MKAIQSDGHLIYFEQQLANLPALIETAGYSKVFVFADTNTSAQCLPVLQEFLPDLDSFDIIETDPGEENKNIDFCIGIWKTLLDFGADRKCLMINLGGGVITDMGGFIASTYKRGVDFINIPTTLLAQVDASVGGKTGIDMDHVKNMIGTFSMPKAVFIESAFLATVPPRELLSGFAEMIKHGLIADSSYYDKLKQSDYLQPDPSLIYRSVEIKQSVVNEDPTEKGRRKILNFGHTIGHAVESYALSHGNSPLSHGEAIAIGMLCEAYLSTIYGHLSIQELQDIQECIEHNYPPYVIHPESFETLLTLMQSDKKNEDGFIQFSLLEHIGTCLYNCKVTDKDLLESLHYYNRCYGRIA